MIRITLFNDEGSRTIPPENLAARLTTGNGTLWVDLTGPDEAGIHVMAETLRFHPLAIEDTHNFQQRPKVEEYPNYLFFIFNPVRLENNAAVFEELDVFIGANFVVTVHAQDEAPVITETRQRLDRTPNTMPVTPSYLLYVLVDTVVDGYFPVLDMLEDEIERLGNSILTNPREELLNRLFELKTMLVTLWRVVWPQREILNKLVDHALPHFDPDPIRHYIRDVSDHLMWIADMVSTFRETLTGIIDLYMSAVSNRLNRVVNRLTVVTVIIGIMTVISGFYGMNFAHNWPPFAESWGVPYVLGLMVCAAGGLYVIFRRLKWL